MPLREMRSHDSPVMSSPLNRMRPEEGRRTPVRQLKKVLLPAPFGPMMARTSSRASSKLTPLSAASPPKRTVSRSVRRRGADPIRSAGGKCRSVDASKVATSIERAQPTGSDRFHGIDLSGGRKFACGREQRLLLRDRLHDPMPAAPDLEDELAHERLMILLAEHLVALRKVVAFLHLEAFEGLDELHRVLAAAESRFLHAELQSIHRLIIRLHVAVGKRTGGVDFLEADAGLFQELPVRRRIERAFKNRKVAIDADEALDLVAERGQVGGFRDGAVPGPLVFPGQAEIIDLVADRNAIRGEHAKEAIKVAADLGEEGRHVGGAERDAGGADDLAARFPDLRHIGVARRLAPRVIGENNVPFLAHLVDE